MGYNAEAKLVFGFRPSKEEVEQLEKHEELWHYNKGDVALHHSGDGRSELYDPVFGILFGSGYDWEPKKISIPKVTDKHREKIKQACKEYEVKYQRASFYLIALIS